MSDLFLLTFWWIRIIFQPKECWALSINICPWSLLTLWLLPEFPNGQIYQYFKLIKVIPNRADLLIHTCLVPKSWILNFNLPMICLNPTFPFTSTELGTLSISYQSLLNERSSADSLSGKGVHQKTVLSREFSFAKAMHNETFSPWRFWHVRQHTHAWIDRKYAIFSLAGSQNLCQTMTPACQPGSAMALKVFEWWCFDEL